MVRETHLTEDEARRIADHEEVKQLLRREVQQSIKRQTGPQSKEEDAEVSSVAHQLKHRAVTEVTTTERELERARRIARVNQFVDYIFFLIYGLIGLMIGLELLGARNWSGFMRFMTAVTAPLLAPFKGLMPDPAVGSFQLMLSYIVALVVYLLLHKAIKGLLRILVFRETSF
ncbi:MAG TPA: hypothetical protein VGB99_18410 [Acidobacteriota bacterium]